MLIRLITLFFILLLSSCASKVLIQTDKDVTIVEGEASTTNKSPQKLIEEYDAKISLFGVETMHLYAPLHLEQATTQIQTAKELLKQSNPESIEASKINTLLALRNLDKAIKNKAAVKLHLKTADTHYHELKNLESQSLLPRQFDKVFVKYSDLIQLLEIGMVQDSIKSQAELIEIMIDLEIETLKKSYLDESISYIEKAKDLDASSYAASSLKEAEELLQSTQNLIHKSYRDRNAISTRANKTLTSAKKLYFIAKKSNEIHQLSNEEIEQHVISNYDFLDKVQSSLEINPIERQEYNAQQNALLEQINILKSLQSAPKEITEIVQEVPIEKAAVILPKEQIVTSDIIYSPETNKAILPELFMDNSYPNTSTQIEEDLEFDSIEIVK